MDSNYFTDFLTHKEVTLPNGETLCYREVGSGPQVLVLIHGTHIHSMIFKDVAPLFANEMRVIAVDMRGFGYSSYNQPITTHQELADDIKLLLDELKISKCSILGWSMGGMVTFYFAAKYPEVTEKLILLSSIGPQGYPLYKWTDDGEETKERITKPEDLKYYLLARLTAEAVAAGDRTLMKKALFPPGFKSVKIDEIFVEFKVDMAMTERNISEMYVADLLVNVTEEDNGISKGDGFIQKLKCPTLILHGELDVFIPIDEVNKWGLYLGNLVTIHLFSDGGHNLFKNHLNEVIELIRSFVISAK